MLRLEEWMEVKDLHRQGHSIRTVAKLTGRARNTVRKALRQSAPLTAAPRQRHSRLDPCKPYLEGRYHETGLSAVRLFAEIAPMGYAGGIDTLRRYLRALDAPRRAQAAATVRFETPPGEQAQADGAYCGQYADEAGTLRKVYAFVMVLSYSRYLYVEFTTRMCVEELIGCHQRAFAYFGGWPHSILDDNMKQVRLAPGEWNPLFLDFLSHHGITPKTHRVRRPRTKGKVERMVLYLKDNFLLGREFVDLPDLQAHGRHWLDHTANIRIHATPQARPLDLLAHEQLTALTTVAPYQLCTKSARQVEREGFVRVGCSRYSVPPEYVGARVIVEQGAERVAVRLRALVSAEHLPAPRPGACMTQPEHVAALWRLALQREAPPARSYQLGAAQAVAATPLTVYEEVIG